MKVPTSRSNFPRINNKFLRITNISVNQDFFELIRRIDKAWEPYSRLGESHDKYFQKIRIVQPADLSFASREVVSVKQIAEKDDALPLVEIESRHFGLFAPYGPMPIYVSEHARNEYLLKKNKAFEQFMNLISQRFAIYQYRCWAQLHAAIGHDKSAANAFQNRINNIVGINKVNKVPNEHIRKLRQSFPGAYLKDRMSLDELQKIIAKYFNVAVNITKRYPTWIALENKSKFILGKKILGKKFYNIESSALIELGPFRDKSFLAYDRREKKLKELIEVCDDFVNQLLSFTVVMYVETRPEWREAINNLQIGKNSWLKPRTQIMKKVVYTPFSS